MRAWPQSGQVFIAHVAEKKSPAPGERNVLVGEVAHFAPLELQTYLSPCSINIWSLRDQEHERPLPADLSTEC